MLKKVLSFAVAAAIVVQALLPQTAKWVAQAAAATPSLIVTEINPDNVGDDNFEYFELYNTTDADINLTSQGIHLSYIYSDDSSTTKDVPLSYDSSAVVPSHAAAVFWLQYKSGNVDSTKYTDDDFKNNYASYGAGADYSLFHVTGQAGMANGGGRGIRISASDGTEISRAYYPSRTSTTDKPAQFCLPVVNNSMTLWKDPSLAAPDNTSTPTPGTVDAAQLSAASGGDQGGTTPETPAIANVSQTDIAQGQPAVISASVTAASGVKDATLYYRVDDQLAYASMAMTVQGDGSYQATIPASALWTTGVSYYVSADSQAANAQPASSTPVHVNVAQAAGQQPDPATLPYLMVTEITPDSTNVGGSDGYEFIEVYNNSDRAQSLADFSLHYRYPSSGNAADLIWEPQDRNVSIQPGKTMIFWVINAANTGKTVADFNQNYGLTGANALVENQNIVKIYNSGMANGSYRGIALCTNTGKDIDVALYNQNTTSDASDTDCSPDKGIIYRYDSAGSDVQQKLSSKEYKGTPGIVLDSQVPATPVHIQSDTQKPTIDINSYTQSLNTGDKFTLALTAQDDTQLQTLTFYYKTDTDSDYQTMNVSNFDQSNDFNIVLYPDVLLGKKSLTFYLTATDGTNTSTTATYAVAIAQPQSQQGALRANVEDGQILSGQFDLKAASDSVASSGITAAIDSGTPLQSNGKAVENTVYFAFDVQGTDLYFQNAVILDGKILKTLDESTPQYTTYLVPVPEDAIKQGQPLSLSINSGDKLSPFVSDDPQHLNNRDDFTVRNVRLLFSDGSSVYDSSYADPTKTYSFTDSGSNPLYSIGYTFNIDDSKFNAADYTLDTTAISNGRHTLTVSDGQNEDITRSFIIDNAAPTITTSLQDGATLKGQITIDAKIADGESGLASQSATLDGTAITLPYETWSGELTPGVHTVVFSATDNAGNKTSKTITFKIDPENPETPQDTGVADNAQLSNTSAQLSVKVTDPSADDMDVAFMQGYKYTPLDGSIKGFTNSVEQEPPSLQVPDGETALSSNDYSLIANDDGQLLTTQSTKLPYQRYEVNVSPNIGPNDKIQLYWKGKSVSGRRVTLYAWNNTTGKWQSVAYQFAGSDEFVLSGYVTKGDFVKDNKVQVLVQDEVNSTATTTDTDKQFTFAWLTDTQYYNSNPDWNHYFQSEVSYILQQRTIDNIKYVIHTGDIVDNSKQAYQWVNADNVLKQFDNAKMPYGVLAGNHDVSQLNNDYSDYWLNYPESRFSSNGVYGGSYQNNRGHYDLISAGGNDFIIVYMGWDIGQSEYDWLNQVLQEHKDRKAILCFHDYLYTNGLRDAVGDGLFENVVKKNSNVIMTLNGHYHGAARRTDDIDDNGDGIPDRTVYQILYDYQAGPEGGEGFLRYITFDTDANTVHFSTYSPALDKHNFFDNDENNKDQYGYQDDFTIPMALNPTDKMVATDCLKVNVYTQTQIGTTQHVKSGAQASVLWQNLAPQSRYFWYVNVSDKNKGSVTSDIWGLITGAQTVDKTALNTLIASLKALDQSQYTSASLAALQAALSAAEATAASDTASADDITQAYNSLEAAYQALQLKDTSSQTKGDTVSPAVTTPVEVGDGSSSSATVTNSDISNAGDGQSFLFKLAQAALNVGRKALETILKANGADSMTVVQVPVALSGLPSLGSGYTAAAATSFELRNGTTGAVFTVHDFGDNIQVTWDIPAAQASAIGSSCRLLRINDDGTIDKLDAAFTRNSDGSLTVQFMTPHFSTFVVANVDAAANPDTGAAPAGLPLALVVFGSVALLGAGALLVLKKTKHKIG